MTGKLAQSRPTGPAGGAARMLTAEHVCRTADGQALSLMRHFAVDTPADAPPALLVHGLAQNRRTWHLTDRSFADYLVGEGFDVWTAELRGHGRSRAHGSRCARGAGEYADHDIPALIDRVLDVTGAPRLLYVGHSLGGVLGLCQHPGQQARIAGLAALGTPLQLGADAGVVRLLGHTLALLCRTTPLGLMPASLPMVGGSIGRLHRAFEWWLDHPDRPIPLPLWAPGSMTKPALREVLASFDRAGLGVLRFIGGWATTRCALDPATGEDLSRRFGDFRPPVFLGVGSHDAIVPEAAVTHADRLLWACGDVTVRRFGDAGRPVGHIDIVLGDAAPALIWPQVAAWLRDRASR